jgi:hypothetical protein
MAVKGNMAGIDLLQHVIILVVPLYFKITFGRVVKFPFNLYNPAYISVNWSSRVMDQNEALSGAASAQGEQPNNQTMESLLESESLSVELPQTGEIRKGMIASIGPNQILVSIGAKSEGVIAGRELEQLTEEERAELQVGQEVNVFVVNPEDQNGNVVLSFKRARSKCPGKMSRR